ncbi:hypothetical protein EDD18DRAFT_1357251 [Armillaria luteobubalina]|uniref:Uncharacterized protein n=1 Tax=Armillaria luteobubalina TaxID=153913 RepID=A0AA39PYD9_9AGAR|nr:hypothetical protein EDD18DRAFT_1357251 [Armillaria luteobubalina]
MSSVASVLNQSTSSAKGDHKDRVLHLIAMLFAELDDIAPGIIPPGAALSVPMEVLPLPEDGEEANPPTFTCGSCGHLNNPGIHNPFKWYAVTHGWAVGVVQGSSDQLSLTTGIPGGLSSKGTTKTEAIKLFNDALSKRQVVIVLKNIKM